MYPLQPLGSKAWKLPSPESRCHEYSLWTIVHSSMKSLCIRRNLALCSKSSEGDPRSSPWTFDWPESPSEYGMNIQSLMAPHSSNHKQHLLWFSRLSKQENTSKQSNWVSMLELENRLRRRAFARMKKHELERRRMMRLISGTNYGHIQLKYREIWEIQTIVKALKSTREIYRGEAMLGEQPPQTRGWRRRAVLGDGMRLTGEQRPFPCFLFNSIPNRTKQQQRTLNLP